MKCEKSHEIYSKEKQKNTENAKNQTIFKIGANWSHMNQNG